MVSARTDISIPPMVCVNPSFMARKHRDAASAGSTALCSRGNH